MIKVKIFDEVDDGIIEILERGVLNGVTVTGISLPSPLISKLNIPRFVIHVERENRSTRSGTSPALTTDNESVRSIVENIRTIGPPITDVELGEVLDVKLNITSLVEVNVEHITVKKGGNLLDIEIGKILLHNVC